jgi:D-alanyl-lipoteichoic acid acyltransferase DltB (MBOAT superfamily)
VAGALADLGVPVSLTVIRIILPVGISFYTFHAISYVQRLLCGEPADRVDDREPGAGRAFGIVLMCLGTAAQHLSQRVAKRPWPGKLENITVGHGVSLLQWRGGGANTPTIRRPTLSFRHQLLRIARQARHASLNVIWEAAG